MISHLEYYNLSYSTPKKLKKKATFSERLKSSTDASYCSNHISAQNTHKGIELIEQDIIPNWDAFFVSSERDSTEIETFQALFKLIFRPPLTVVLQATSFRASGIIIFNSFFSPEIAKFDP